MRIYRANGFVILEDVSSYLPNQLAAFKNGNSIHIRQVGVNKKEVIVPYHAVKDVDGEQAAEDVDAALAYVESILYASSSTKKTVTIGFDPPASAYFNARVLDVDARSGDSYLFSPKYFDEIEFDAFIVNAFCFVDGEIEVFIHSPTGLFVGNYEFEYKVI